MRTNNFDPTKPVVISAGHTEAGKQISSRNAVKHGCCATGTLILKNENIEDYKALEATWFNAYSPKDDAEKHMVQELANSDWFLQRATRNYADAEARIMETTPDVLAWTEDQHKSLARFLRYRTTHTNTVAKNRKAIEDYRKNHTTEQHKEERLTIAKDRLKIYQEKNKPAPTFEETIDLMRRKAVALGYRLPDPPKL